MHTDSSQLSAVLSAVDQLLFEEVDFSDAALEKLNPLLRGNLYLIRAQLRLMIGDAAMTADCRRALALLPQNVRQKSIYATMRLTSPSSMLMFPGDAEGFRELWEAIEATEGPLTALTGPCGASLTANVKSEIRYFQAKYRESLESAEPVFDRFKRRGEFPLAAMMTGYNILRSRIALGHYEKAREVLAAIIRHSGESPEHRSVYAAIRLWVNVITGWGGDNPRYHYVPDGTILPVIEDRIAAIHQKTRLPQGSEAPLERLAESWDGGRLTMRKFYRKIYCIVVAHLCATQPLAETDAPEVFRIARDTGLIQPIIEYGKQIVPMLTAAKNERLFDGRWLTEVIERADAYDDHISGFRNEDPFAVRYGILGKLYQ